MISDAVSWVVNAGPAAVIIILMIPAWWIASFCLGAHYVLAEKRHRARTAAAAAVTLALPAAGEVEQQWR